MFAKEEKERIMNLAFLEADKAEQQGEIPIGAV
ncbi:MAG: tRNA-specific adenosine deaminase, partial [Lactobacillus iners]|nr:tRNA-specific adenosine deaminase [Lactobacillus iners]